jgi:hypothetical protein
VQNIEYQIIENAIADTECVINSTVREKPKTHVPKTGGFVGRITVFGDQLNAGLKMLLPWDDFIFFFSVPGLPVRGF